MRHVIVAGGVEYVDIAFLTTVLLRLLHKDDIIVSGCAPGADSLAIKFAQQYDWRYETLPADWSGNGKYKAGFIRNSVMAAYSQVLIAFWDGQSGGTNDMIQKALKAGLEVHVYHVKY